MFVIYIYIHYINVYFLPSYYKQGIHTIWVTLNILSELKEPETSSSDNKWLQTKRTKQNKRPLFKRCTAVCRYIHHPSEH